MSTYRTLREIESLRRDHSASLAPRTARDAGLRGRPVDEEPSAAGFVAILGWGMVGAGVLWILFLIVLGAW